MEPGVWIAVIFGGILILGGLFFPLKSGIRVVALFIGAGLILVGAFGPEKIKDFAIGTDGLHISRHQPTEQERELVLKLAEDKPSPEIEKEGKEYIKEAEERAPEKRAPEDYLALATEKWRAKDYDAAFSNVFAGLALNPENIRIKAALINSKADTYYHLGLKDQGIKYYKEAIELDPGFSWPHNNLGVLFENQGKLKEAEAQYNKAIALDPKYAAPHNNWGVLYKKQGKLKEAEAQYKKAIALDPKYASPHHNLGNIYKKQGELKKAEAEYKRAIALDSQFAHAHNGLGALYYKQENWAEAQEKFEEALRLQPDLTLAKENLEKLKRKMEKGE